jgi:hypothetical protein
VRHASIYISVLHVKASRARVFQSGLKTDRGATVGGACGTIAEIASRSSRRRTVRYDGLRRSLLPLLYHFHSIRSYEYCSLLVFYLRL